MSIMCTVRISVIKKNKLKQGDNNGVVQLMYYFSYDGEGPSL